jgi:trans-aconitate 2-methyltransferase
MLARAQGDAAPTVDWVEGDIAAFAPEKPDLIFTNAALQWVDGPREPCSRA